MQTNNTLKYVGVKCYAPPQTLFKSPVMFQNSVIYHKTRQGDIRNTEIGNQNNVKCQRIHTEGSQPFYEKQKFQFSRNYIRQNLKQEQEKVQVITMNKSQFEGKSSFKHMNQNNEKQLKFTVEYGNVNKNQSFKRQKMNQNFTQFYEKPQNFNKLVESKLFSNQGNKKIVNKTNNYVFQQKNRCINGQSDKCRLNYARNYVKTQTDEIKKTKKIVQKVGVTQLVRKSYRSNIRNTENQDTTESNNKFRLTSTFGEASKSKQKTIFFEKSSNIAKQTIPYKKLNNVSYLKQKMDVPKQQRKTVFQFQNKKGFAFQQQKANPSTKLEHSSSMYKLAGKQNTYFEQKQRIHMEPFQKKSMRVNTEGKVKQNKIFFIQQQIQNQLKNGDEEIENERKMRPERKKVTKMNITDKEPLKSVQTSQVIDWKKQLMFLQKIGEGTFGKVYKAKLRNENGQNQRIFAVKKVFIDKKYKSRQLQIVNQLSHQNVMKVHNVYTSSQNNEQYLNIVMDFYQKNLFQTINECNVGRNMSPVNFKKQMSDLQQKILIYQILKGLSYIHSLAICHRDIKPHNMLVKNWQLVLCDFGSAKRLIPGQNNLSYICSRCYRAPQLIFGSTSYTTQIDLWSLACVILQMLNKTPLFIGESSLDHFLQVIKVIGTPTKKQILEMNPSYDISQFDLPLIKRKSFAKLFPRAQLNLIDLLNKLLVYNPNQRLTAIEALGHTYFDELRRQSTYNKMLTLMPKQKLDSMFTFSDKQFEMIKIKVLFAQKNKISNNDNCFQKGGRNFNFNAPKTVTNNLVPMWWKEGQREVRN